MNAMPENEAVPRFRIERLPSSCRCSSLSRCRRAEEGQSSAIPGSSRAPGRVQPKVSVIPSGPKTAAAGYTTSRPAARTTTLRRGFSV